MRIEHKSQKDFHFRQICVPKLVTFISEHNRIFITFPIVYKASPNCATTNVSQTEPEGYPRGLGTKKEQAKAN